MTDLPDTIRLRGAGGAVLIFDWPLAPAFADQVARGQLTPADDDARRLLTVPSGEDGDAAPVAVVGEPPRAGPDATREAWAAFAAAHGIDVDGLTRDQIIGYLAGQGVIDE